MNNECVTNDDDIKLTTKIVTFTSLTNAHRFSGENISALQTAETLPTPSLPIPPSPPPPPSIVLIPAVHILIAFAGDSFYRGRISILRVNLPMEARQMDSVCIDEIKLVKMGMGFIC